MVFVPFRRSLLSASSRHCLDTAVKAWHIYCVNKHGKYVFWGALLHVPQPAGPTSYRTWRNVSLPVPTERYFSTISLAIQNLFLHASKLGATCWGQLAQSVSNDRVQTFLILTWRRMEQGFMFANTTPPAALLKNRDNFAKQQILDCYVCVSGFWAFRIWLIQIFLFSLQIWVLDTFLLIWKDFTLA